MTVAFWGVSVRVDRCALRSRCGIHRFASSPVSRIEHAAVTRSTAMSCGLTRGTRHEWRGTSDGAKQLRGSSPASKDSATCCGHRTERCERTRALPIATGEPCVTTDHADCSVHTASSRAHSCTIPAGVLAPAPIREALGAGFPKHARPDEEPDPAAGSSGHGRRPHPMHSENVQCSLRRTWG